MNGLARGARAAEQAVLSLLPKTDMRRRLSVTRFTNVLLVSTAVFPSFIFSTCHGTSFVAPMSFSFFSFPVVLFRPHKPTTTHDGILKKNLAERGRRWPVVRLGICRSLLPVKRPFVLR